MSLMMEVQKDLSLASFFDDQNSIINHLNEGKSIITELPAGSGKSLCFQLVSLNLPKLILVVTPFASLQQECVQILKEQKIPAGCFDASKGSAFNHKLLQSAEKGELKILMVTVERFKSERFRSHLERMDISLMVVDEAHSISEWSHCFRPEYVKLPFYKSKFKIPQVLLITSAATTRVIKDIQENFTISVKNILSAKTYRRNLYLQITPLTASEKGLHVTKTILDAPQLPTIVYTTLPKTAEALAMYLSQTHNIQAAAYHEEIPMKTRKSIQEQFASGNVDCLITTTAVGAEVNKKDVHRIIHYDMPKSIEHYSEELGNAGDDYQQTYCEVLASRDSIVTLENAIYGNTPEESSVKKLLSIIQNRKGNTWEFSLQKLSKELNMNIHPLQAALVYLDMEKIIHPQTTYFEEYSFKYHLDRYSITQMFSGEKKEFIEAIFNNSHIKKTWTYVNVHGICTTYDTSRERVILALEFLESKGWIVLQSRRSVDVYEIITKEFILKELTDAIITLFHGKEKSEIERIEKLMNLLESNDCISKQFANYFGEDIEGNFCGHCSYCIDGAVSLNNSSHIPNLTDFDFAYFRELSEDFIKKSGELLTPLNLVKFLCGIMTPQFKNLKIKDIKHYGTLEKYPFLEVKKWVNSNMTLDV